MGDSYVGVDMGSGLSCTSCTVWLKQENGEHVMLEAMTTWSKWEQALDVPLGDMFTRPRVSSMSGTLTLREPGQWQSWLRAMLLVPVVPVKRKRAGYRASSPAPERRKKTKLGRRDHRRRR